MLKETETEETIVFFVTFLSLVAFHLGGWPGPLGPPWLCLCLWVRSHDVRSTHFGHVVAWNALRWLPVLGGFEKAANLVVENSKNPIEALDHCWKLLNRCRFVQKPSTYRNEKCKDHLIASNAVRWQDVKYAILQQQQSQQCYYNVMKTIH